MINSDSFSLLISQNKPVYYGMDNGRDAAIVNNKKIFYCIHGKPKDCCIVDTYSNVSGSTKNNLSISNFGEALFIYF